MEVTKCDRCGTYVDKNANDMPILIYAYSYAKAFNGDKVKKSLCYNCYADLEKWLDIDKEATNADND